LIPSKNDLCCFWGTFLRASFLFKQLVAIKGKKWHGHPTYLNKVQEFLIDYRDRCTVSESNSPKRF
jgi:hypothetical protein